MSATARTLIFRRIVPTALLLPPLALLAGGTLFFAAYALGAIEPAAIPGGQPGGYNAALLAGLLGMLLACASCFLLGSMAAGELPVGDYGSFFAAVAALLAAAFVVARQYTYDSYYLPTLRRISEDGSPFNEGWLIALLAGAAIAVIAVKKWPVAGFVLTSGLLVLCLFTAVLQIAGH